MTSMNEDGNRETVTPWHAEPWAWLVFGLPAATVLACLLTIYIATRTPVGLVSDDYYKQGLEINRVLDREARARALGLELRIGAIERDDFTFSIAGSASFQPPAAPTVSFAHATRSAGDQSHAAEHLGGGHYRGTLETLSPGPWYVEVATPEWRLVQRVIIDRDGGAER